MDTVTVNSSNIDSIGYDTLTSELVVNFKGGGSYSYASVPLDEYAGLMSAGSHGKYFNANIKNRYAFKKLK